MLFNGTDEAARTDDPNEAATLDKINDQIAKQYELIKALQDTINAADAAAEKAAKLWQQGYITNTEKKQIKNKEINRNIVNYTNEQITKIIYTI